MVQMACTGFSIVGFIVSMIVFLLISYALLYCTKKTRFINIEYWICLFSHNLVPEKYSQMLPFGIGGSFRAYRMRCLECNNIFPISEKDYKRHEKYKISKKGNV